MSSPPAAVRAFCRLRAHHARFGVTGGARAGQSVPLDQRQANGYPRRRLAGMARKAGRPNAIPKDGSRGRLSLHRRGWLPSLNRSRIGVEQDKDKDRPMTSCPKEIDCHDPFCASGCKWIMKERAEPLDWPERYARAEAEIRTLRNAAVVADERIEALTAALKANARTIAELTGAVDRLMAGTAAPSAPAKEDVLGPCFVCGNPRRRSDVRAV